MHGKGLQTVWTIAAMAVAWTGLEASAQACSPDPCWESHRLGSFELAHGVAASDGALVFSIEQGGVALAKADLLPFITVTVTDGTGAELAGTLEALTPADEAFRGVVWRPATALPVGAALDVSWLVDNDAIAAAYDEVWLQQKGWCAENIDGTRELSVTGLLPPMALPEPAATEELSLTGYTGLDDLVCCDGAMPRIEFGDCSGDTPWWSDGFCASTHGVGRVRGTLSWTGADADEGLLADSVVRLVVDGVPVQYARPGLLSVSLSTEEPFCGQLEAVSVSTGETFASSEVCFGQGAEDQLGPGLLLDPSAELEASCASAAYVCEHDGIEWDPDACEPWDDPGGDDGADDGADDGGSDGGGSDGGDAGDGGDGADDGGGDGGDESGGDGGLDDDVAGRGCACSTGSSGGLPPTAMLLMLVGAALVRRRR